MNRQTAFGALLLGGLLGLAQGASAWSLPGGSPEPPRERPATTAVVQPADPVVPLGALPASAPAVSFQPGPNGLPFTPSCLGCFNTTIIIVNNPPPANPFQRNFPQ